MTTLVLASASPARRATLQAAGITPRIEVSNVDEDAVLAAAVSRFGSVEPADAVLVLAQAKADDVARRVEAQHDQDQVVLGCDSMLEFNSQILGKPKTAEQARERWQSMRGGSGVLHTGHWLVDTRPLDDNGTGGTFGATSSTTVHFADVSDEEIDAYVDSGEPLNVAGAFTIDGLGGPFIRGIEGDHHGVVGLSLPLLRELLREAQIPITALWERNTRA